MHKLTDVMSLTWVPWPDWPESGKDMHAQAVRLSAEGDVTICVAGTSF